MTPQCQQYITAIKAAIITACKGTHLFPSLMMAQACLEGNNGQSKLAALHHNCFGIKAGPDWPGATVSYATTEYEQGRPVTVQQTFRSYPTPEAGFTDRIRFLQVNPRYAKAGVFTAASPEEQARCFGKAGYATDPAYPEKLISIISTYHLKQYDPA